MKKVFVLAVIVAFAVFVQAREIDTAIIKIIVAENGEAVVSHLISFDSRNGEQASFLVLDNKDIRVFDSTGELEFEENGNIVSFFPRDLVENYGVTIEYTSPLLTSKTGEKWNFSLNLETLNSYNDIRVELSLPKNIRLSSHFPQGIVFAGEEFLEIEWEFENVSQSISMQAEYVFSGTQQQDNFAFFTALIVIIALVAGLGGVFFYVSRKKEKTKKDAQTENRQEIAGPVFEPPEKEANQPIKENGLSAGQKDMLRLLTENEEKVVKELLKEDNIAQRNLGAKTGLPKSTLSRTIKRLEIKGLIKVNNIGLMNKIELSKEFREKQ